MSLVQRTIFVITTLFLLGVIATIPLLRVAAATTTSSTTIAPATSTPTTTPVIVTPLVDTTKVLLTPVAQTRITNLAANVSNRLDATLRRLTNVHDRIRTRIDKLAQSGINTEAATTELSIANSNLETAKNNLMTIDREVAAFIGSSNPRAGFIRLKSTYVTIYNELTLAHSSLRRSLDNLDGTINTPVATSTATTTTTE